MKHPAPRTTIRALLDAEAAVDHELDILINGYQHHLRVPLAEREKTLLALAQRLQEVSDGFCFPRDVSQPRTE